MNKDTLSEMLGSVQDIQMSMFKKQVKLEEKYSNYIKKIRDEYDEKNKKLINDAKELIEYSLHGQGYGMDNSYVRKFINALPDDEFAVIKFINPDYLKKGDTNETSLSMPTEISKMRIEVGNDLQLALAAFGALIPLKDVEDIYTFDSFSSALLFTQI